MAAWCCQRRKKALNAGFKCSFFRQITSRLTGLCHFYSTFSGVFLNVMNISQNPLNPKQHTLLSEQNKTWRIWYVGFSDSSISVFRLVCLVLLVYGVCPVPRSSRAKSSRQGDVRLEQCNSLGLPNQNSRPLLRRLHRLQNLHRPPQETLAAYTHACYIAL